MVIVLLRRRRGCCCSGKYGAGPGLFARGRGAFAATAVPCLDMFREKQGILRRRPQLRVAVRPPGPGCGQTRGEGVCACHCVIAKLRRLVSSSFDWPLQPAAVRVVPHPCANRLGPGGYSYGEAGGVMRFETAAHVRARCAR